MTIPSELDFVVHGVEVYRLTPGGWLLVGTTAPPDADLPEVVNEGCVRCDKAVLSLSMEQVLFMKGIHCAHCGQLRRSTV